MQELLDAELDTPITFRLPNSVYRTSSTICRGQKIGTSGLVMDVLRTDGVWVYVGGGGNVRKVPMANVVSVRESPGLAEARRAFAAGMTEKAADVFTDEDEIAPVDIEASIKEIREAPFVAKPAVALVSPEAYEAAAKKTKKKPKKKKAKKKVGPPPGPKT